MITLPRDLQPWAGQLGSFPHDIALALGPLVQRIAAALTPIHGASAPGLEMPEGIDGIANRGNYERLLASDWLLADEAPEEFDRRAAMREHLFLRTARRDPAETRGSAVLFDAGPDQLGSPRIGHLAILIALARRAERGHANFSWGVLQDATNTQQHGLTERQCLALLEARSWRCPSESQIKEWIERSLETSRPEEIWLVGSPQIAAVLAQRVSTIAVEDALDPGTRCLHVEIRPLRAPKRTARLELPGEAIASRLLRDPYADVSRTMPSMLPASGPPSGLVFGHGSSRLFTRTGKTIFAFSVPRKAGEANLVRPRLHTFRNSIVAVNHFGRTTAVMLWDDDNGIMRLVYIGKTTYPPPGETPASRFSWMPDTRGRELGMCIRLVSPNGIDSYMFALDGEANLFRYYCHPPNAPLVVQYATNVLAVGEVGGVAAYVRENEEHELAFFSLGKTTYTSGLNLSHAHTFVLPGIHRGTRAYLGYSPHTQPTLPLIAVEEEGHHWTILHGAEKVGGMVVSSDQRVVGAIQTGNAQAALVTLRDGGHALTLMGPRWERTLANSTESIIQATVAPTRPLVAYSTAGPVNVAMFDVENGRRHCSYTSG